MEQRRLLNKTDLLELLEIAEDSASGGVINDDALETDVSSFIIYHKIEPGDGLAKEDLLYKLYLAFSSRPVTKTRFNKEFSLYFQPKNGYYLINKTAAQLIEIFSSQFKRKKRPLIKKRSTNAQFKAFLDHFEIKKNGDWTEDFVLLHFLDKWIFNEKRKQSLTKDALISLMKIHYEHRKTKNGYVFNISSNIENSIIESVREAWKKRKLKDRK